MEIGEETFTYIRTILFFFVSLKNCPYSIERDSCNFGDVFEQVT